MSRNQVKALEDKKIVHVACGGHHTVCVDGNVSLFAERECCTD